MSSAFRLGEIYILIGLFIIFFNFQSKFTALILGARYGKTEVCELLLSKGANVNSQTKVNILPGYFVLCSVKNCKFRSLFCRRMARLL